MIGSNWTDPSPSFGLVLPRLHATLNVARGSARQRLTLITAPAGYGKTTLVTQWARTIVGFGYTVVAVESMREPAAPHRIVHLLDGDPAIADSVSALIDALTATDDLDVIRQRRSDLFAAVTRRATPCIIVIDDLDHFPVTAHERILEDLLTGPESPTTLSVVATGRLPIDHPLGHLAATGQFRHLFARDLMLTPSESADLLALRDVPGKPLPVMSVVMEATEGWAAGIALAGHLLGSDEEPGQWLPIDDYVSRTILDSLDARTRRLLHIVAPFPWLDRDLWHAIAAGVGGEVASFDTVRAIVPMARFRERSDGRSPFHLLPILQASLGRLRGDAGQTNQSVARDTDDPLREDAFNAATAWFLENDLLHDAIDLARAGDRWNPTLTALVPYCRDLAIRDDHAVLIDLLAPLPDAQLLAHDDLAFWYVLSLLSVGDVSEGTRLHARIAHAWQGSSDPLRLGRLHVLGALLAIWQGNRELALSHSETATATLPIDAYHERMRAAATAEVLSNHLGQRDRAIKMFETTRSAREHLPWDQRWWATFVLPNQADRTALEGNLSTASTLFQHLVDSYSEAYPDEMALMHMRLALIDLERGNPEAASTRMDAIGPVAPIGYWMQEVPLVRAKILHAQDRDHDARAILYAALRDAHSDLNEIDVRRTRAVLAQLWLDRGEFDLADAWSAEETLSMDTWPRSFGQTVPGTVMAHLRIVRGQWADAHQLLDALIAEGSRRQQPAPLVRVYALKALAYACEGDVDACHRAIRVAIGLGEPGGFQRSYLVGNLDTRTLLGMPEQTLDLASSFLSQTTPQATVILSAREREVLRLAAMGLTNAGIADRLFLSPLTVKNHLARIYQRLSVRNRSEAVIAARSRGLL